jgi:hypothetical protein
MSDTPMTHCGIEQEAVTRALDAHGRKALAAAYWAGYARAVDSGEYQVGDRQRQGEMAQEYADRAVLALIEQAKGAER